MFKKGLTIDEYLRRICGGGGETIQGKKGRANERKGEMGGY